MFCWLAIIIRRMCDGVLQLCGSIFVLLQRNVGTPGFKSGEPSSSTGRVSGERAISSSSTNSANEMYWRDVFENPDHWWDNRLTKKNPQRQTSSTNCQRKPCGSTTGSPQVGCGLNLKGSVKG